MKIIITESQMTMLWLKRRYEVVERCYNETMDLFDDVCDKYESSDEFVDIFFNRFVRGLEETYYYSEGGLPDNIEEVLMDYYKTRVTKLYHRSCSSIRNVKDLDGDEREKAKMEYIIVTIDKLDNLITLLGGEKPLESLLRRYKPFGLSSLDDLIEYKRD